MSWFTSAIFTEAILPFLLVFVLVFAILQKSKILGDGKSQIDALVSLAIALILIAVPTPRNYIVSMIPWLAVALVVLLIFLLIYGFVASDEKGLQIPDWLKKTVLWLGIIFVVVLVLVITGSWDKVINWFNGTSDSTWANVLIFIAVVFGVWFALGGNFGKDKKKAD